MWSTRGILENLFWKLIDENSIGHLNLVIKFWEYRRRWKLDCTREGNMRKTRKQFHWKEILNAFLICVAPLYLDLIDYLKAKSTHYTWRTLKILKERKGFAHLSTTLFSAPSTLPLNRQGPHQQMSWGTRLVLELPCLTPCFDCYGRRKNLEFCLLSVIGFGKKIRSNQSLPKSTY